MLKKKLEMRKNNEKKRSIFLSVGKNIDQSKINRREIKEQKVAVIDFDNCK